MDESPFAAFLTEDHSSDSFVRRALGLLEAQHRCMALVLLSDWVLMDIPSHDLFEAVGNLQRPSWGSWNGLVESLRAARRSALRSGGKNRDTVAASTRFESVLELLDSRLDRTEALSLSPLAELARMPLRGRPRLRVVLSLAIALRNRVVHEVPTEAEFFAQASQGLRSLLEVLSRHWPLPRLQPADLSPPWFVVEAGAVFAFNGLRKNGVAVHVASGGKSRESVAEGHEILLLFQRLLGKTGIQETDFRRLLGRLAPEEIRGFLLGDFLVGKPVGAGGFATVHVGRQLSTGRKVAIKILHDGFDADARIRFRQEGSFLSRVSHPGVIDVIFSGEETFRSPRSLDPSVMDWAKEFGQSARMKTFLVLEWVEGRTLEAVFRGIKSGKEIYSIRTVAEWFADCASALAAVHSAGLIHRDVKPSNLMLTAEGETRIMDFGIARSQDEARTIVTTTGRSMGTPSYMSPEQLRASDAEASVGETTDVYSLCSTFYELFTRARLYRHDEETADTVRTAKLTGRRPESPRLHVNGLSWEIETILLGGLEADPADRFASMNALERDLRRFLADEPIHYRRPSFRRRMRLGYRRHRTITNVVVCFLVVVTLGMTAYILSIQAERENTAAKERETRANLERSYVDRGLDALNRGEFFAGLPWLVSAMRLYPMDERRQRVHRLRLASVLEWCPRLVRLFLPGEGIEAFSFEPQGRSVVMVKNQVSFVPVPDQPGVSHTVTRGAVRLVDVAETRPLTEMVSFDDTIDEVRFTPDGLRMLIALNDSRYVGYDIQTGLPYSSVIRLGLRPGSLVAPQVQSAFAYEEKPREGISFSDDGVRLFAASATRASDRSRRGSDSGCKRIFETWNLETGRRESLVSYSPPVIPPEDLLVRNGSRVAIGSLPTEMAIDVSWSRVAIGCQVSEEVRTFESRPSIRYELLVCDGATGKPIYPPIVHPDRINAISFSKGGDLLVTSCADGGVRVFVASTGEVMTGPLWHPGMVTTMSFGEGGDMLAVGTGKLDLGTSMVRVWDARTGKPISRPFILDESVARVELSHDQTRVVAITEAEDAGIGAAQVFSLAKGSPLTPPLPHGALLREARFSRDDQFLLTVDRSGVGRAWLLSEGELLSYSGETNPSHREWLDPTGRFVLSDSPGPREIEAAGIWCRSIEGDPLGSSGADEQVRQVTFLRDGQSALLGWSDGSVWRLEVPGCQRRFATACFEDPIEWLGMTLDENLIVVATSNTVLGIDMDSGVLVGNAQELEGKLRFILPVPGSPWIVAVTAEQGEDSWPGDPRRIYTVPVDGAGQVQKALSPVPVDGILVARNRVVVARNDRKVDVYSLPELKKERGPELLENEEAQAISPDGRFLLVQYGDRVRVLDLDEHVPTGVSIVHAQDILSLQFSRNGDLLLTSSSDRTARMWERSSGRPSIPPLVHEVGVDSVFLDRKQWLLVTGGSDGTRIWDAVTGQAVTLKGQVPHGNRLRFGRDGSRLLSTDHWDEFGSWQVVMLPEETRPVSELEREATLLGLTQLDESGALSPVDVLGWSQEWNPMEMINSRSYVLGDRKPFVPLPGEKDFPGNDVPPGFDPSRIPSEILPDEPGSDPFRQEGPIRRRIPKEEEPEFPGGPAPGVFGSRKVKEQKKEEKEK